MFCILLCYTWILYPVVIHYTVDRENFSIVHKHEFLMRINFTTLNNIRGVQIHENYLTQNIFTRNIFNTKFRNLQYMDTLYCVCRCFPIYYTWITFYNSSIIDYRML